MMRPGQFFRFSGRGNFFGTARFGSNMLGPGEAMLITVTVPNGLNGEPTATLAAYGSFTLQVVPTKGAAITVERSLPADILAVNDLH